MKKKLYLGSQSHSRKKLMKDGGFDFEVVSQSADEQQCDWNLPLRELLHSIAGHKMDHVIMPDGSEGDQAWVVTADTMGLDHEGDVCAKPKDREEAISRLKSYRKGAETCTSVCVERKQLKNGQWQTLERKYTYASARYVFDVSDRFLDQYLDDLPKYVGVTYRDVSGAVAIEDYGNRFLKSLEGSYSAVVGLPMYELQQLLLELGYFDE